MPSIRLALALSLVAQLATAQPTTVCPARSSDWLSLLPDGEEKRRFILDCTGCHQFDDTRALVGGTSRTQAGWESAISRMLGFAGASSGFPVIASSRQPGPTAAWLHLHLDGKPAPAGTCRRAMPAGASIREYLMPESNDLPHDIAVDAYGLVIITGMFTHRMWVLDPKDGSFNSVAIPVASANPRALEIDPVTGAWWVALGNPQTVARYRPEADAWTTWPIGIYPHSIALDRSGRAWFNGHFTRTPELIGYVKDGATTPERIEVPPHPALANDPAGPIPYEIRAAPDGKLWGSELQGNRVFSYDPVTRAFRMYDMPLSYSGPRRLDMDAGGIVWIPAYGSNMLVRLDPATGRFESIPLPQKDAVPYVVRVDRGAGKVWIGTSAGDVLLAYEPSSRAFTSYPLPSNGALVRHLAIDARNHDVWLAYGASPGIAARIARLTP